MNINPIKNRRFIIRNFVKEDKASLIQSINSREVLHFMSKIPYPYKSSDADIFLQKATCSNAKDAYRLAIEIDGEVAGGCGIILKGHKAGVGYWLAKKYWGKGIGTEVVYELLRFCFRKLNLSKVTAKVFLQNKASQRVLEKNGFVLEGVLRKDVKKNGKFFDIMLFGKIR